MEIEADAGEDGDYRGMGLLGQMMEEHIEEETHEDTGEDMGDGSEDEAGDRVSAVSGREEAAELGYRGDLGAPHAAEAVDEAGESAGDGAEEHGGQDYQDVDEGDGDGESAVGVEVAEGGEGKYELKGQ